MGYVKGEAPGQSSLFPPSLDEWVPDDHPVRVIAAFVGALDLGQLGFERAEAGVMERPAYDPADLLKLYLYGYLNRIRSSRRLERECCRNVEVMWLLGKLAPDFKTIADFRRRNSQAFVQVCVAFVRFCAKAKLLGGELVATDGSKFQAVSAKHGLIVHHEVTNAGTDNTQLEPTAKAAQEVLGRDTLTVVADAGYSNGAQFVACEEAGITPYVPPNRAPQRKPGGEFYSVEDFSYQAQTDTYRCPAGKVLMLKQINRAELSRVYAARVDDCSSCAQKSRCTRSRRRFVSRHWYETAFERMAQRLAEAPDMMSRRRSLAEHPFGQIKCWVMGDGRLLLRGLQGARGEMALAVLARNLKRVMNILGNKAMISRMAIN